MKIRRYMGSNAQEAILKVKMDLGNDALILNTKKVRQKGFLKFFSKPMVEVLAAIDDNKPYQPARGAAKEGEGTPRKVESSVKSPGVEASAFKDEKFTKLETKVNQMENTLQKIYDKVVYSEKAEDLDSKAPVKECTRYLQMFYNNLVKNDVEPDIAKSIIEKAEAKITGDCGVDETAGAVYNVITSLLGVPQPIQLRETGKPTVVLFVGPTGVGKTTTLAKIAASFTLTHKKSVALITADTYRISAVDQLKTYADIMGIPLSVIYSTEEITQALEMYADKDLILIDTAGRSHKDKQQFVDVDRLVELTGTNEVYLVLSATTSNKNAGETIANYSILKNYKLILTKIDECTTSGMIINTRHLSGRQLAYITIGQNVPDDIELADINKITKNLMGSING